MAKQLKVSSRDRDICGVLAKYEASNGDRFQVTIQGFGKSAVFYLERRRYRCGRFKFLKGFDSKEEAINYMNEFYIKEIEG